MSLVNIGVRTIRGLRRRVRRRIRLPGLSAAAAVSVDRYGVPSISAADRLDALRILGFVTARERLFQMDLLRRSAAGELSEIMGSATLHLDLSQRVYEFRRRAHDVLARLPEAQVQALRAYSDGVNAYTAQIRMAPLECLLLRYRPRPWTPVDSILVGLGLFQELTGTGEELNERMMTVMARALPPEIFAFLSPDHDEFGETMVGGSQSRRPLTAIPTGALKALLAQLPDHPEPAPGIVDPSDLSRGSNGWVVAGSRSGGGSAILANDMHLDIGLPGILCRASLDYADVHMAGVLVPGLPVIICGSSEHVAWGSTNVNGDFLDLVALEMNPNNPNEYRTPCGWQAFDIHEEVIRVRGGVDARLRVRSTIWGPVLADTLLGDPVAVKWTALDPEAVDFGLLDIDQARTVDEAVAVFQGFGGPPLNVMIVDRDGDIAWTLSGRVPVRHGHDGATSVSWADGDVGWDGYIAPGELPSVVRPPAEFLVTANNRAVGAEYPHIIGRHYSSGYRAHRIAAALAEADAVTEGQMFQLQLDTGCDFYQFYRDLMLDLIPESVVNQSPVVADAMEAVRLWDCASNVDSRGLPLLVSLRDDLIQHVIGSYLVPCRAADPTFAFRNNCETPLRRLLTERPMEALPRPERYGDWAGLLRQRVEACALDLRARHGMLLRDLVWGTVNRCDIRHPLADVAPPALRPLLSMPSDAVPGCLFSIRVGAPSRGACLRLVVSPGRHDRAIIHLPGGQSGDPLSPHFADQHAAWLGGVALPLTPAPPVRRLWASRR